MAKTSGGKSSSSSGEVVVKELQVNKEKPLAKALSRTSF
jgi:hypothetical protein